VQKPLLKSSVREDPYTLEANHWKRPSTEEHLHGATTIYETGCAKSTTVLKPVYEKAIQEHVTTAWMAGSQVPARLSGLRSRGQTAGDQLVPQTVVPKVAASKRPYRAEDQVCKIRCRPP